MQSKPAEKEKLSSIMTSTREDRHKNKGANMHRLKILKNYMPII